MADAMSIGAGFLLVAAVILGARGGRIWSLDCYHLIVLALFVAFVLMPLVLSAGAGTLRLPRAYDFLGERAPGDTGKLQAALIVVLAGITLFLGHLAASRWRVADLAALWTVRGRLCDERWLGGVAWTFTVSGGAALGWYAWAIGGWRALLDEALLRRIGMPPSESSIAFLINLAPLASVGSFVFLALVLVRPTKVRVVGLLASFIVTALTLFHQAGRLNAVIYVATLVMGFSAMRGRRRVIAGVVAVAVFVAVTLVGRELVVLASGDKALSRRVEYLRLPGTIASTFVGELGFPYLALRATLAAQEDGRGYRWFVDVPLGLAHLLPNRVVGIELPPTATELNTAELGVTKQGSGMPIDLLSLGLLSAGPAGTALVFLTLGALAGLVDRICREMGGGAARILHVALAFFLASRVFYGEPKHALVNGFGLLMFCGLLVAPLPRLSSRG